MPGTKLLGGDAMLLSERLRVTLAHEIATGVLPGGSVLDEQMIASRFNVSRTPVREALRQLSAIDMIDLRPRRGAVVIAATLERTMALFEASAELEATCARLATYRMTMAQRCALQEIHRAAAVCVEQANHDGYVALNQEFHDLIYRATQNEVLVEQAISFRTRLSEFRGAQLRDDRRIQESWKEHDALLTVMAQGDGVGADRWMRAHLLNAASALQSLASQPRPNPAFPLAATIDAEVD